MTINFMSTNSTHFSHRCQHETEPLSFTRGLQRSRIIPSPGGFVHSHPKEAVCLCYFITKRSVSQPFPGTTKDTFTQPYLDIQRTPLFLFTHHQFSSLLSFSLIDKRERREYKAKGSKKLLGAEILGCVLNCPSPTDHLEQGEQIGFTPCINSKGLH